ncbi:MAG: hypothetical protein M1828_006559 [Chrysothrix sp. TS-e1954]|nr:MAG: hypothetical protein M1828_006559 [Chrysothrix sp. TS-e1954]
MSGLPQTIRPAARALSSRFRPANAQRSCRSTSALTQASIHHTRQPRSISQHHVSCSIPTIQASSRHLEPLSSVRSFHTTPHQQRDHHFDTLKFVQRLESEGLSKDQAQALMVVLGDVIDESIQNLTRTMVPREDALKSSYTQKVDFSALRTELLALDSGESTFTRASHERLSNELQKLGQRLRDEVSRTQASVRLDLNLEKGRIREEASAQELRIKETETRIEQEVAGLRERVEGVKFDTLRWLAGVSTGTAALLLGAWRLFM